MVPSGLSGGGGLDEGTTKTPSSQPGREGGREGKTKTVNQYRTWAIRIHLERQRGAELLQTLLNHAGREEGTRTLCAPGTYLARLHAGSVCRPAGHVAL